MKRTFPKMISKSSFLSAVFYHFSPTLIKLSTARFLWDITDKTFTFTAIPPPYNYFDRVGGYQDISGRYGG